MINRLPGYYRKSKIVADLYAAIKNILDSASNKLDSKGINTSFC